MKVLRAIWSMGQAGWGKFAERFRNSFPFKLGVPTLVVGIIVTALTVGVGIRMGVIGDPAYHQRLIYAVGFVLAGLMGIVWGLFWDKPESPDEPG